MLRLAAARSIVLLIGSSLPCVSSAQSPLWLGDMPVPVDQTGPLAANFSAVQTNEQAPPRAGVTIPAGTRVMMVLRSPLHTTSGTQGSGLYLETLYPVIQGEHVVIPAHTQVQGDVERDERPGHIQRRAEFKFRFTSLIFPNNHVASIEGALQSIPGSKTTRAERNDGTLRTVNQTEKVIIPMAAGAASGALLGSVQRTGVGTYIGAGLGAGVGLGGVLLHRGDEISLPRGTQVEMVLQSPLSLEPDQAAFNARNVPPLETHLEPNVARSASHDEQQETQRKPRPKRSPILWPWLLR